MQLSNAAGDPAHGAGVAHASQKLQDLAGKSGDDLRKAEVAETA